MNVHCPLPSTHRKATFAQVYSELALHQAVIRAYSKPLFTWRKALGMSHDGRTLYDFARHSLKNIHKLHQQLESGTFQFRPGIALHYNFNGKHRTINLFPWEERIVDLLLYRVLTHYFHGVFEPSCHAYRMGGFGVDQCQRSLNARLRQMRQSSRSIYFVKRDVQNYFPSLDHDQLLAMLAEWVEPDDILFKLLRQRIEFEIKTGDRVATNQCGVAFGTAIACFFANLYLTPLDRRLASVPGLRYYRYADDLLAFSGDRVTTAHAEEIIGKSFESLRLRSKPKHHRNFYFPAEADCSQVDEHFEPCEKFRHLGLEFRADGGVGLSRDKSRKIQNLFRFAWRRYAHKLGKLRSPKGRARKAIEVAKDVLEHGYRSIAIIDYYLKHVDDEEQLRRLDRWLAEAVLAIAFDNGHKKGNFKKMSFAKLRAMGLPSLRHRRRLLRHGHLESSFFTLRTEKLIEQKRRRLPPGYGQTRVGRFPPELKAVALPETAS
jgi:hypothetical protein